MTDMTVVKLARRTGTSPDTIRYYERIGLLPAPRRSSAGYRLFGEDDVHRVSFIKGAQSFGLRLDAIAELLEIRNRGVCPCGHSRDMLVDKLAEIDEQIARLARLRDDIRSLLASDRSGQESPDWPCGNRLLRIAARERTRQ